MQKGLDHGCDWFYVEPINQQSGNRDKEIKMTKQNKNGKDKATLEVMVKSGSQLVLMREDGSEQPIEDIVKKDGVLKLGTSMKVIEMDKTSLDDVVSDAVEDDPLADWFYYDSWWNQFRGHWLQSEKMTVEQIRLKADDAWECGDYKEMINLMAELICRLEKK